MAKVPVLEEGRKVTSGHKRHVRIYGAIRRIACPIIKRKFNFHSEEAPDISGPYIVLANHNTDYDMILVGSSFKRHMYFVASQHVLRWGFLSKLLVWAFSPITRAKGTTDAAAALDILRALRAGENVCLFAEGDRSFDGRTGRIHPTVGKLIKSSKAALVTYRLEGLYLSSPRWSAFTRRGKSGGRCVNVYTPEELKAMTAEDVYKAVQRDLQEDAYERQERERVRFRGKRLAEQLETSLYICPKCGSVSSLKSRDDEFFCVCGFRVRYDEYGCFTGEDVPFKTVTQWDIWQNGALKEYIDKNRDKTLFSDGKAVLLRIENDGKSAPEAASGKMMMTDSVLSVGDAELALDYISEMAMVGRDKLLLTFDGENYQIISDAVCCLRKYMDAFDAVKNL